MSFVIRLASGVSVQNTFIRQGWRLSIPGTPERAGDMPDVFWTSPDGGMSLASATGKPDIVVLDFLDLARARISRSRHVVEVSPLVPDLSPHSLEHFVMDVLLPRLIAESGALVVHGALVSRGADALCLIGESGQGKSTLSAALRNAGWAFHGDDALVLRVGEKAGIAAEATYASLRLFPDSLERLYPDLPAGVSPVADYLDKYRLELASSNDPAQPCRLRAVLVLGDEDPDGAIRVKPLSGSTLCMALVAQSFALDPTDSGAARSRLSMAGAIATAMPGFQLHHPRDYARLPEVIGRVDALLDGVLARRAGQAVAIGRS